MDIIELALWLVLFIGTVVAWCAVAVAFFFVGWRLAADGDNSMRERLLFYALLIALFVLVFPASVLLGTIISAFTS